MILSDSGDNPGGGGSGRTTQFLTTLVSSNAKNVLYGSFFDPKLAEEAHRQGLQAKFNAVFNQEVTDNPWTRWDKKLAVNAKVIGLQAAR